jgi:hypothetical protein
MASFRPARFTDIHRTGPPTTADGREWAVRLSAQPVEEWLRFFDHDAGGEADKSVRWAVNVQFVVLRFDSSPDNLPRAIEQIDERIRGANESYRRWLEEAHRKGDERRQNEVAEADRVRDLNERFKDL